MPEDDQTSTNTTTDQTNPSATNDSANANTDPNLDEVDLDIKIPSLEDIEYATPSAYIDPDLPANPDPIKDPNEPEEEKEPEEEVNTLEMTPEQIAEAVKASNEVMVSVAEKIANSRDILIALSSDPSVDELSSAIALSSFLGRLDKHTIAIYTGAIPNALEFLNPEDIFEKNADVMQDFVITLNKEKADHLRYKVEGESVEILITPYKNRIVSEDLSFSYGDYNVDLVLSLNVNNGVDLDSALREYGAIMHGANVVNITAGNPGKFGEIEWSNRFASSVSEMVANLLLGADGNVKIDAKEATALLTGIVAATDRFSRANTASSTMQTASKLMEAGADQQLVAANISDDLDNQFFAFSDSHVKKDIEPHTSASDTDDISISFEPTEEQEHEIPDDGTALMISHNDTESSDETEKFESENKSEEKEKLEEKPEEKDEPKDEPKEEAKEEEKPGEKPEEKPTEPEKPEEPVLADELKATEASLSGVGIETPSEGTDSKTSDPTISTTEVTTTIEPPNSSLVTETSSPTPAVPTTTEEFADATSKYSQMLTDALKEPASSTESTNMASALPPTANPAATSAPAVATPEVSGVPDINYGQTTNDILPPPPAPPVDIDSPMPVPAPSNLPPTSTAPSEPTPNSTPDASAFTIPNM